MPNNKQKQMQNRNQLINNYSKSATPSEEEFIAKLSTLASVIQTIGGVMSTTASFLALQKFQRDILLEEEEEGIGQSSNDERINQLEKQIQYLINEIEDLKGRNSKQ